MDPSSSNLPIRSDTEMPELLTLSERIKIEALEEYRVDFRRRLEERLEKTDKQSPFWKDKLLAPAMIVLLTVGLSGYVIPKVLERSQKSQRAREVTNTLLDDIAFQTAEMQVAFDAHADATDNYWIDAARANSFLGDIAVKRNIGAMTREAFDKENELLENDRNRIHQRMETAAAAYDEQLRKFRPWLIRTRVRIGTLYAESEDRTEVERLLDRIDASVTRADLAIQAKDKSYDTALNGEIRTLVDMKKRFDAKQLTRTQYRNDAATILEKLRVFPEVEGPPRRLDDTAIAETLKTIQGMRPST